jgi:hypothetical protein
MTQTHVLNSMWESKTIVFVEFDLTNVLCPTSRNQLVRNFQLEVFNLKHVCWKVFPMFDDLIYV